MQVLHLAAGNLYGGVETLLATLARYRSLCPEMTPHYALCFEGRLSQELRAAGSPVYMLGPARISRPWTVWRARRSLRSLLESQQFDIVVCHECWPYSLFAPVARGHRLPLAFWAHDIHKGRHWLERWASWTRPDLVIANSRITQEAAATIFPGLSASIVHYPVAMPAVDEKLARQNIRTKLKTSQETVVIVLSCRLERWKGHTLLLEALAKLPRDLDWVCWIAGGAQRPHEQKYLDELRHHSDRLDLGGRTRWLGQRGDVPELLAAADIHCQPNIGAEPFGIAFVEALHAGLPVVTMALGGALEIIDASCGVLVPPDDPARLAEALRQLIGNSEMRKCLGAAGPERARQLCDAAQQLHRLNELLANAVWPVAAA